MTKLRVTDYNHMPVWFSVEDDKFSEEILRRKKKTREAGPN
jgi:hypothetical protein